MSKTEHAATLAARLMEESHWNQSDAAFREAYFQRTGDRYATVPAHVAARDALALIRIGKGVARRAFDECNGVLRYDEKSRSMQRFWTEADGERRERLDGKAKQKAETILARYGATVKLGGDPRGYVMRLHFRSDNLPGRDVIRDDGWGVA
jgi:hypothetical protein